LWGCSAPPAILPPSPQLCQNDGLSFISSIGETEESGWAGGDSRFVFGKKFPGERGSVRRCVVMQQPAKVRNGVFAHFHAFPAKHYSSMRSLMFRLPGRFLCEKKIMRMLLTLFFTCLHFLFFGLDEFGLFHWEDCRFVSGS
jgi:hypothetical protein